MKWKLIFVLLIVIHYSFLLSQEQQVTIAIQPFGRVSSNMLTKVKRGINSLYQVDVRILPQKKIPHYAYYKPRKRYRAEKLLHYLEKINRGRFPKILGLTVKDISTTKGSIKDWGIFGLGSLGGESCVVSTFRLKQGRASNKKFYDRLIKVVNHELGHTFGLNHCPVSNCLMEDAKGTIKTVDRESGNFCDKCRSRLQNVLKNK